MSEDEPGNSWALIGERRQVSFEMLHMRYEARRDRDAASALHAIPKEVRRRVINQGRQRFVAFDAHTLLENQPDGARPGHPY